MVNKRRKRLKQREQAVLLSELSELTTAGYALPQALDMIKSGHPNWSDQISEVQRAFSVGSDFSQAFAGLLSENFVSYLALAKQHGRFDQTLGLLVEKVDRLSNYQRQLKQALTYPLFLMALLFLMVLGLERTLYPVFDQLSGMSSKQANGNGVLWALHGLFGLIVLLGLTLVLFYLYLMRQSPLQRWRLLAALRLVRPLEKPLLTGLLAENLAIFLGAGLTLAGLIDHFSVQPSKKAHFSQELARSAQQHLQAGGELASWLNQQSYLQPGLAAYLTRGFDSKTLAAYLSYYAKLELATFDRTAKRAFALLQPILFGLIGLTIVLLYLAMLLPLYQNLGGYQV
ncbi:type II secretion system F family protein [Fructobacillus sp. M1-13]|uniref:Type II secretion system protein GspF domain-containing protein n=1 Tax=Fructobacillus papyriferae TaxID=2713171 RepID=A0ABS5QS01_9LACO|nr:type II secretion system F family protein [Fructobacillus papyriferae]MBS9335099.1 hypothetical protein [Fructobacillus papyriferae]MCD2159415.1 type II secretion system F family protein [Fructobacillus papyriferae]